MDTNTITFREHAELPVTVRQAAAIERMWRMLEARETFALFGMLFDYKIINLAEFEQCNYLCGVYADRFDWAAYTDIKMTIAMLLLAEMGELE